jgi:hypothetical protein
MRKSILALAIGGILALPVAAAAPASAETIIRTVPAERVVVVRKKHHPRVVRHVYVDRYGNRQVVVRERAPRRVIVRERPTYYVP